MNISILKSYGIVFVILLLLASSAHSSDSDRHGFVGGFGIGHSPYANWDLGDIPGETNMGTAFKLFFGYGISHSNILVWEISGTVTTSAVLNNTHILQGINGFRWFHFYESGSKFVFFTSLGAGRMLFGTEFSNVGGFGFGLQVGAGIEFKRHFHLDLNYIFGSTSASDSFDTDHKLLMITLSVLAL